MTKKKVTLPVQPEESQSNLTLDEILLDLKGFGIEDTTETIKIYASGKTLDLKMANIPNEQELEVLLATEEYKGHAFVARVKCEILARSISWVNGVKVDHASWVVDPITKEEVRATVALRNIILGWGQETVNVLWKILMVHCQRIEDRLIASLPDAAIMTDVEARFLSRALQEMQDTEREVIRGSLEEAMKTAEV